jgi:hypothetical protein
VIRFPVLLALQIVVLTATLAQEPQAEVLKSFQDHRINHLREKIYVYTDRTFYLTGETMWFSIFTVDGTQHKPLDLSRVVYIELLNHDRQVVLQTKVPASHGAGSGSLFLPATLTTGRYLFRAYTSWMKNFSPDFYFNQELTLVNPFLKPADNPPAPRPGNRYGRFFPEGGHLVRGLRSAVGIEVTDANGEGVDGAGFVLANDKDTVARFGTQHGGLGRFDFEPAPGVSYRAFLSGSGRTLSEVELPPIRESGVVMRIYREQGNIIAEVSATREKQGVPVLLFAHTRSMVAAAQQLTTSDRAVRFIVPDDRIREGITHFTLFDGELNPLCERLYFKSPENLLAISVKSSQPEYGHRNKVRVSLSGSVAQSEVKATLSLAVYRLDSLPESDPVHIAPYLLLSSDLKGKINTPDFFFTGKPEAAEAADLLMLTRGWSRFRWQEVMRGTPQLLHIPEHHGHFITARVTDRSGNPVRGVAAYLSFPSASGRLYAAVSDRDGRLQFEVQNFFSRKRAFLQMQPGADSLYSLTLVDPFTKEVGAGNLAAMSLDASLEQKLINRSLAMQVQDVFHDDEINRTIRITEDTSAFFGTPDERYYLDDYTRFPLMEEVLREYVKGVWVRKDAGQFRLKVVDRVENRVFDEDPLVVVDGVPVRNINSLMEVDPLRIKRVDVMTRTFFLGPHALPGLVSFTSYDTDMAGVEIDPATVTIDYEGLQLRQEFYSPRYETGPQRESRLPDRRTLLHFEAEIQTLPGKPGEIEFYTSDLSGTFMIVAEGLSTGGTPGTGVAFFTVK